MVDMTREAIQAITKELKQYRSPALNDKLYLHFKGWKKIEECLGEYSGVRALWHEGNGLRTLDNLGNLKELRCLYVQQNCLEVSCISTRALCKRLRSPPSAHSPQRPD